MTLFALVAFAPPFQKTAPEPQSLTWTQVIEQCDKAGIWMPEMKFARKQGGEVQVYAKSKEAKPMVLVATLVPGRTDVAVRAVARINAIESIEPDLQKFWKQTLLAALKRYSEDGEWFICEMLAREGRWGEKQFSFGLSTKFSRSPSMVNLYLISRSGNIVNYLRGPDM